MPCMCYGIPVRPESNFKLNIYIYCSLFIELEDHLHSFSFKLLMVMSRQELKKSRYNGVKECNYILWILKGLLHQK